MKRAQYLFLMLFLILMSNNYMAQSTGKILGKVIDSQTGEGIPFANVIIEGTSIGAASDIEGNFVIVNVPPDVYTVTASYIGYQKVTIADVRVNVNFTTNLEFELPPGDVELEAIVVQGERNPLIREDLTNPTVAITSETIDALPVDNISDVIELQAGVVTGDDGVLHFRGGYGNEVAYQINGLSINDPYGNSRSVGVATNAVQEVSVSTGTFSAEFGNALSGVVNYVTREGGEKYTFSIRSYAGEYLTNRDEIFYNVDDFDPLNRKRVEATFGGPIPLLKNTKFFVSGIYEDYGGLYYGQRIYNTTDSYLTPDNFRNSDERSGSAADPYYFNPYDENSDGLPTGDSAAVPMNQSKTWNLQANLSHRFSSLFKIKYEIVYDKGKDKDFERAYFYNPDGLGWNYSDGIIQSFDITHTISNSTFYTLKGSYSWNQDQYYLYENQNDLRYLPSFYRKPIGNTFYYAGGTDNEITDRETKTYSIKGDFVSQLFDMHEVKAGFEWRKHTLTRTAYFPDIYKISDINGQKSVNSLSDADLLYDSTLTLVNLPLVSTTTYKKEPVQFSAYIQDKMELAKTLIFNAGLRYEYFDANSEYNYNFSEDITENPSGYLDNYLTDAEAKHMISPRLSVSYPITDKGIIRFSYGHFYQIGSLSSLYLNNKRWVPNSASIPDFGNPNVEPQKSIQYEIGLQQQLTENFKFDLTGYYKDVRDYIFFQTIYTPKARQYDLLTNLAYSNVRGITLSFLKRRSPGSLFSASLDYTFQIAEGNRTEPEEDLFFSEAAGKQTETFLVPLSFDRMHLLNGSINLSDPNNWSIGAIVTLQTGTPYTPQLPPSLSTITFEQRSETKPMQWNVNLKAEKYFEFGSLKYSIFVQVENLFDTQNERYVYASSGRALTNVEEKLSAVQFNDLRNRIERGDAGMIPESAIDNYYYSRPERLNPPREVRLGFSIIFN